MCYDLKIIDRTTIKMRIEYWTSGERTSNSSDFFLYKFNV